MSRLPLQAIGLLLLLVTLCPLTGAAGIAAALADPEACGRCCDAGEGEEEEPGTCSVAECACYLCLSILPQAGHRLTRSDTEGHSLLPPPGSLWPTDYILTIDYPPERFFKA